MIEAWKETDKQRLATKVLTSSSRHIMLYGGSRSGKTVKLIRSIIVRAAKCPESDHLLIRRTFKDIKVSIWLNTLPKVFKNFFPSLPCVKNNIDFYITLPNGSKIWIAGLDDKERVEKILGNEYSTIFFNEASQLQYKSIQVALTRLAQKNELKKKAYYDENPPSKKHWSFSAFFKKINPLDGTPLKADDYAFLQMNPEDNKENIDSGYFDILSGLASKDRTRFLDGEFFDADENLVYYEFNFKHILKKAEFNHQGKTIFIGMDFNVNPMTGVAFYIEDNCIFVFKEFFQKNSDTSRMSFEIIKAGLKGAKIIPDSTGRNRKTSGKSDFIILKENSFEVLNTRNPYVKDRVNCVNTRFKEDRIFVSEDCINLINDLNSAMWLEGKNELDKKTNPMLNQIADALGYGVYYHFPINDLDEIDIEV